MMKKRTIWKKLSQFQKIELVQDGKELLMKLNGWPQVHSREEELYHENVATLPMMLARHVKRCAILGGGDGLAARNMLRFRGMNSLILVELDPGVIEMCSTQPDFAAMNKDIFRNPRLKVIIGDAIAWFINVRGKYDIIINDIETAFTNQPRKLTLELHFKLFKAMAEKLTPGGVAVVTVPDDFDNDILEGFFDAYGTQMSAEKRNEFVQSTNVFVRARLLLETLFPYILQWTIRFPILGTHSTFYLSHQPLTRLRRFPNPPARHIQRNFFKTVLR